MAIITMEKLTGMMCRWPFGDPQDKGFHFCGHRRTSHLSYCDEHKELARSPAMQRRNAGQKKST